MSAVLRCAFVVMALVSVLHWNASPTAAQNPFAPPSSEAADAVSPASNAPENATSDADPSTEATVDDDTALREQTIYIPYEKLRKVFEQHGRGVFLPYEKFQELWQAAQDKTRKPEQQQPPVGALITDIENEATVAKDVVSVRATVAIELLTEGWHEVPLRLSDVAITAATIGDQPARILGDPAAGYRLLVEKPKGEQAKQVTLVLKYNKAIQKAPGRNSVQFSPPQAPVSRWQVRIPQSGVKVDIHPMIAAAEQTDDKTDADDDSDSADTPPAKEETVLVAFVGAAPTVRIEWTPKAEGAMGLAALATVNAQQQIWITEGVARTRTTLAYSISRAELSQLTIDVPADQKVVNVLDANVRQWAVAAADDEGTKTQTITVQLFEPAKNSQTVVVELEKFTGENSQETFEAPLVEARDVGRQQGTVVVSVGAGLRAEAAEATGLLQVDPNELPGSLRGTKWNFSYRYAALPYTLVLAVEKVEPRIQVDSLVEVSLQPERLSLATTAVYTIEQAGVFRLELDVPTGFDIRRVYGVSVNDAAAVQVDSHHLEGEKRDHLIVNLARKAQGRVALRVEMQRELNEPDLLAPTGKAADVPLPIPMPVGKEIERAVGRLIVYAPESLRVNPDKTEGVRSISFADALKDLHGAQAQKPSTVRPVLAFAFTQEAADLSLTAQRRNPFVTIRQLLVAQIEDGVVKYDCKMMYSVRYSGIKSLRVDVPEDAAADLRNNTPGIRDEVISPAPDDLPKGYVAWRLTPESELLGDGTIDLSWEKKIDELKVGGSVDLKVPYLRPAEVDRAWGQIVLVKTETLDVVEKGEPKGLRPIDPQHDLMRPVEGAARAFEFHDDWELTVTARRYELEEVKRTAIELAVLRMVVTRADEVAVQALYRIRSARQQLELKLPGEVNFDTDPVRIDGRRVPLQTQDDKFFVPLATSNPDKSFLLELRYTVPGDGSRFEPPEFPLDPAVQKVYLATYLPTERVLLDDEGPWSEEFGWKFKPSLTWHATPYRKVENIIRTELCHDLPQLCDELFKGFPTDGQPYLFSTLRPAPLPDGALTLTTTDRFWLHTGLFLLVAVGGVLLLPANMAKRAVAVGLLIVAIVLCGVLTPVFAMQVLNGVLGMAIFLVVVLWIVWYFVHTRPAQLAAEARIPKPAAQFEAPKDAGKDLSRAKVSTPTTQSEGEAKPERPDFEAPRDKGHDLTSGTASPEQTAPPPSADEAGEQDADGPQKDRGADDEKGGKTDA